MRIDIRRRILTSFEEADRERDPARRKAFHDVRRRRRWTNRRRDGRRRRRDRPLTLARDFRHIDTRDASVILIEATPSFSPPFPTGSPQRSLQDLERLGVDVRFGKPVTAIANAVTLGDEVIPAHTIVWPPGAPPWAAPLGVELDRAGRVLVNPDLTMPGHPEIFVIGDMRPHSRMGAGGRCRVWPGRDAAGAWATANIVRAIEGKPARPFSYRDLGNMATIGRNSAVADIPWPAPDGLSPGWHGQWCTS